MTTIDVTYLPTESRYPVQVRLSHLQEANNFVGVMEQGVSELNKNLDSIVSALEAYQEFLTQSLKNLQ